jgi:hypothetical protein
VPPPVAPWNVTEQLPVAERMQVVELNEPPVVPGARVKVTVPDGMLEAVVKSLTVAVQDEVWEVVMLLGVHTIEVEVLSKTTVIVVATVGLPLCVLSPP